MTTALQNQDLKGVGGTAAATDTATDTATGDLPGFAVYVHWPFCLSKCPYCDFNSHVPQGDVDHARFERALRSELSHMAGLMPGKRVGSVFFGGGTPSLMHPETVGAVIRHIDDLWGLQPGAEITLEANPTSVEAANFASLKEAGVNRVSLGIQALGDADLKFLGRTHTVAEARAALDIASRNFQRYSFDLIYARPGQKRADWRRELEEALNLARGHLSLYQLTIEPGTPFARWHRDGRLKLPPEGLAEDFYTLTQEICDAGGLPAYEISNHAAPGEESRHNLTYWRYGAYAGVGPGAHGRLMAGENRLATQTVREPAAWLGQVERMGHGIASRDVVGPAEQIEEMLLMGLRLAEGLDLTRLERLGWQPPKAEIRALEADGLVAFLPQDGVLKATAAGRMVLNGVIAELALAAAEIPP